MKGFLSRTGARLKRKLGPLPLWAWVAIALGALIYYRRRNASAVGSAPDSTGAAGAQDSSGADYWSGTGASGGSSGGGGGDTSGNGNGGDTGGGGTGSPAPGALVSTAPIGSNPLTKALQTITKPRKKKPPKSGHPKPHKPHKGRKPRKRDHHGRTKTHKARPVHHAKPPQGGKPRVPAVHHATGGSPRHRAPAAPTHARHAGQHHAPAHHAPAKKRKRKRG